MSRNIPKPQTYQEIVARQSLGLERLQHLANIDTGTIINTREQAVKQLQTQLKNDVQSIREGILDQLNLHRDHWTNKMEQALNSVIDRAIERGDPQALTAVWDRLIGKPRETLTIDREPASGESLLDRLSLHYGEIINAEITEKTEHNLGDNSGTTEPTDNTSRDRDTGSST
jgi:hypothetical protein